MTDHRRNLRKKPINYFEIYDNRTGEFLGSLVDISLGGVRLLSEKPMEVGDSHELHLRLPEEMEGLSDISFIAVCRWCMACQAHLMNGTYNIGLQMGQLSPASRDAVERFTKSSYFHDWRELPDYKAIYAETV